MEPDRAPNHARNFLRLASTGWYDGLGFHRIAKGFVVQAKRWIVERTLGWLNGYRCLSIVTSSLSREVSERKQ